MNELLWKDYRVNRMVLIVGIVLLFGPLFAVGVVNLYAQMRYADQIYWFDKIVSTGLATLAFAFVTFVRVFGTGFLDRPGLSRAAAFGCLCIGASTCVMYLFLTRSNGVYRNAAELKDRHLG